MSEFVLKEVYNNDKTHTDVTIGDIRGAIKSMGDEIKKLIETQTRLTNTVDNLAKMFETQISESREYREAQKLELANYDKRIVDLEKSEVESKSKTTSERRTLDYVVKIALSILAVSVSIGGLVLTAVRLLK